MLFHCLVRSWSTLGLWIWLKVFPHGSLFRLSCWIRKMDTSILFHLLIKIIKLLFYSECTKICKMMVAIITWIFRMNRWEHPQNIWLTSDDEFVQISHPMSGTTSLISQSQKVFSPGVILPPGKFHPNTASFQGLPQIVSCVDVVFRTCLKCWKEGEVKMKTDF